MVTSGDVTVAQDGAQSNVKLHPYLVALVRWCVSCVWSTATVLLHRLVAGSLPAPTIRIASFTVAKPPRARAAGTDHLHPEPKVDCQVLHTPGTHSCDVIFVHGLYGSLANTWRQGDWRSKYKPEPNKVPLLRPADCKCESEFNEGKCKINEYEVNINEVQYNVEEKLYDGIQKILPDEDAFITEKFYNENLLDQVEIVDNYETQAKFVRDLFENENRVCDSNCDSNYKNVTNLNFECEVNEVECKINEVNCKCKVEEGGKGGENSLDANEVNCECKLNEGRKCEVGCGCVCDMCYSSCWPRDWIKEDYPEARVISINYTSDPYLWRPLWVKECKRLRLHERAEQMTKQLLELGVGERPIIWVGHSKGGLFIKQIYCEAYEAYLKTQSNKKSEENIDTSKYIARDPSDSANNNNRMNDLHVQTDNDLILNDNYFSNDNEVGLNVNVELNGNIERINSEEIENVSNCENNRIDKEMDGSAVCEEFSPKSEEEYEAAQARLWRHSAGFMFYSVPHRGSPLADIKTPLTARSIELLEISKDCALVLSLQERWLAATGPRRPQVRSLVETSRTLMAVLWLRIVSVPSADAGIGALYGVSVDHREICKPASRHCLLYRELMTLMRAALAACTCDRKDS